MMTGFLIYWSICLITFTLIAQSDQTFIEATKTSKWYQLDLFWAIAFFACLIVVPLYVVCHFLGELGESNDPRSKG